MYPDVIFASMYNINGVFGQRKRWFKAQYTRTGMFIHQKYAPRRSV